MPAAQRSRRYAVVGTGARAALYIGALARDFADAGQITAWCDHNGVRMAYYDEILAAAGHPAPARYHPGEFGLLLAEDRPDVVIITSPDHTHADYAARALQAGCDVILEKPVVTTPAGARQLASAAASAAGELTVGFNYRYSPRNAALREVIAGGEIGAVTSVHFEWALDTVHGADYFRRWHREKASSGGLLVHKASHHFDLVNWWIRDVPDSVYARGALRFYGPDNAARRGLAGRPERSAGAPDLASDPFALDLQADETLRRLYADAAADDGYVRDRDVFSDGITIEDNMAVLVTYAGGALLTYSLNAHAPWEGYRVTVNGDAGRAELEVTERPHVRSAADGDVMGRPAVDPMTATAARGGTSDGTARPAGERLVVQRHWEPARVVPVAAGEGTHAGGDGPLLDALFGRGRPDPLGQRSGYADGLASAAIGLAANESMATGLPVSVASLGLADAVRRS